MGCLSIICNVIWILSGGWVTALGFLGLGAICCITVVGIPLGVQAFKMAALTIAPFGKTVVYDDSTVSTLINVLWICIFGWWAAFCYVVAGAAYCVTIVGIPFGLQLFKMAKLALMPFAARVMPA